jgi:CMP-N,N'-diacetyllegionaminic acid synthase
MKFHAIIPARAGSKGLLNKNILNINGKPLIAWSIEQALDSKYIDNVIVSTDSKQISDISIAYGAKVPFMRPVNLAEDSSSTESVLVHAASNFHGISENDAVILLQPTSPLRTKGTIDSAINIFQKNNADSLFSACVTHSFFWQLNSKPKAFYDFNNRPRRQDISEKDLWYKENGSIYITKVNFLLKNNNRLGGNIEMHLMNDYESFEIDNDVDFLIAEKLMTRYL